MVTGIILDLLDKLPPDASVDSFRDASLIELDNDEVTDSFGDPLEDPQPSSAAPALTTVTKQSFNC